MRILVTGSAGFIGYHVSRRLLAEGHEVIGLDGMTPYYDVTLKADRHGLLEQSPAFERHEFMLEDGSALADLMRRSAPDMVIHLAAQAGVRYSLENPGAYIDANIRGTFNLLEACRANPVRHLMLASTSSIYGANTQMPFRESDPVSHPLTLYAATKHATETMAHSYSHLWAIPTTVFRFFTVYGPWGRPDMALFLFTSAILNGRPIEVFNHGESWRDFTYIDDLVEGILRLSACVPPGPGERNRKPPAPHDTLSPAAPMRVVNIGGGQPVKLTRFIDVIEDTLGMKAERVLKPIPKGDVERTFAASDLLEELTGFRPRTPIETGVPEFVSWFRSYYKV